VEPLVSVRDVTKSFARGSSPIVHAVNGVSFDLAPGETLGLIGESGSGKSTVGRLVLGLQTPDTGQIAFEGRDLALLNSIELRRMRARMTVVFQEPYQSLNPRQTIRATVEEPLAIHEPEALRSERRARAEQALANVALDPSLYDRYPHELSGGQQQRVGIARAIVTEPDFVVLDEPTSSLDLSVRGQILELLADLREEYQLSYLLISHDIATVRYISDRIAVMYLGQIVEIAPAGGLVDNPEHPYTRGLLSSALSPDPNVSKAPIALQGEIPGSVHLPTGCFLYGRCPIGTLECTTKRIPLHRSSPDHEVACIKAPYAG